MSIFLNILSLTLSLLAFVLSLVSYLKVVRIEKNLITLQTPKEKNKENKTIDEEQQKKVNELLSL